MQIKDALTLFACAALLLTAAAPGLQAADWDKKTTLKVNEPIEVPGAILQPGNYVLKLVESEANRHVVRFMNEREDQVISTVIAIPNSRLEPTGDTEFGWYETPADQPPAMRAWFYPGDTFGQEFVYDENRASDLAAASKRNVMSVSDRDSEQLRAAAKPTDPAPEVYRRTEIYVARPDKTTDTNIEKSAQENERMDRSQPVRRTASVSSQSQPASDETLMAQNRQPSTPQQQRMSNELPETAGAAPLMALLGLASLAGSLGIGAIRRRNS